MRYYQTIKNTNTGKVIRVRKGLNLTVYNAERIECMCIGHYTGVVVEPDHITEVIENESYTFVFEVWF